MSNTSPKENKKTEHMQNKKCISCCNQVLFDKYDSERKLRCNLCLKHLRCANDIFLCQKGLINNYKKLINQKMYDENEKKILINKIYDMSIKACLYIIEYGYVLSPKMMSEYFDITLSTNTCLKNAHMMLYNKIDPENILDNTSQTSNKNNNNHNIDNNNNNRNINNNNSNNSNIDNNNNNNGNIDNSNNKKNNNTQTSYSNVVKTYPKTILVKDDNSKYINYNHRKKINSDKHSFFYYDPYHMFLFKKSTK